MNDEPELREIYQAWCRQIDKDWSRLMLQQERTASRACDVCGAAHHTADECLAQLRRALNGASA